MAPFSQRLKHAVYVVGCFFPPMCPSFECAQKHWKSKVFGAACRQKPYFSNAFSTFFIFCKKTIGFFIFSFFAGFGPAGRAAVQLPSIRPSPSVRTVLLIKQLLSTRPGPSTLECAHCNNIAVRTCTLCADNAVPALSNEPKNADALQLPLCNIIAMCNPMCKQGIRTLCAEHAFLALAIDQKKNGTAKN